MNIQNKKEFVFRVYTDLKTGKIMKAVTYASLDSDKKQDALDKLAFCDWDAGLYLRDCIINDDICRSFGSFCDILLLYDGEGIASFCTYAEIDEIDDDTKKPWIGFVYTFPQFRGRRCAGRLIEFAEDKAIADGFNKIYISSEEKGLYEKYGYRFLENARSVHGYDTQIFVKELKGDKS